MSPSIDTVRAGVRRALGQAANDEIVDALADSPAGRALNPLAKLLYRNAALSLNYEIARGLALAFAYLTSEEVEGDYAEFGVWRGRTFLEAWRVDRATGNTARRHFAFDSFEGLPPLVGRDVGGRFAEGEFSFDRAEFERRLRRAAIPPERVHLVTVPFDRLLAEEARIPLEKVALAYLDSPLHATTVDTLEYVGPRLSPGAVLMFDAWYTHGAAPDEGQQSACAEWLDRHPDLTLVPCWQYHWAGQAFIVRHTPAGAPDDGAETPG